MNLKKILPFVAIAAIGLTGCSASGSSSASVSNDKTVVCTVTDKKVDKEAKRKRINSKKKKTVYETEYDVYTDVCGELEVSSQLEHDSIQVGHKYSFTLDSSDSEKIVSFDEL